LSKNIIIEKIMVKFKGSHGAQISCPRRPGQRSEQK